MNTAENVEHRQAKRRGSRFFLFLEIVTVLGALVRYVEVYRPREKRDANNEAAFKRGRDALDRGQFAEAQKEFLSTLDYAQRQGNGELAVATSQSFLADSYRGLEQYDEAIRLDENARPLLEKYQSRWEARYAGFLCKLGRTYQEIGRDNEGVALCNQALAVQEKVFGPNDLALTDTLNALVSIDFDLGQDEKALSLAERSLAICQAKLGPKDPRTAWALSMLSLVYDGKGVFTESERLAREALPILESNYGSKSPQVDLTLNRLGLALEGEHRLAEAEAAFRRALTIREARMGPDSSALAIILNNLSRLYGEEGKQREAAALHRRAVAISIRQAFGIPVVDHKTVGKPNRPIGGQPTDGSINGSIYTNSFFQFSLRFPDGWKVLNNDVEVGEASGKVGVLLVVGSVDKQVHGTRWIIIAAAKLPPASDHINAEDFYLKNYLKGVAEAFKGADHQMGRTPLLLSGNPTETTIEGRRVVRLDMTSQVNNIPVRWSQLLTIAREYGLLLMFSDPVEGGSGIEAAQAIKSLHFLGKTN
jgi:tetratricopeptide (TPR) repeat protein